MPTMHKSYKRKTGKAVRICGANGCDNNAPKGFCRAHKGTVATIDFHTARGRKVTVKNGKALIAHKSFVDSASDAEVEWTPATVSMNDAPLTIGELGAAAVKRASRDIKLPETPDLTF